MDKVRAFIEENIDNVINIYDEIGYLSSHGVPPLSANLPPQFQRYQSQIESLTKFNSLLSKNYSISEINLKEEEIPESIDTLIIAGPKEEFSDWELFQIDQFLMKGKSLAFFMESFNEVQQSGQQQMYQMNQPVYLPLRTRLEDLLEHYGVNVKKSYVMDKNCYINRDRTAGEMAVYFAPVIKNENINHGKPFMKNIKEMLMIKISPLESFEESLKKNDLKLTNLFSSSNQSWEMSGRINLMPWMIRPPVNEEEMESQPLAYLIEGEFPSYFADKPVPEKPEKEEEGKEDEKNEEKESQKEPPKEEQKVVESKIKGRKGILAEGKPGRIFLIGTSEILKDNFIDDQGTSPNAIFLLNTIDYLNNQEDIAVMRSKVQRFNPLKDTKAVTRTFVKVLNIAGLPILFILFGFMIWFRRKAKRRVIQAMFLKTKKKGDE
jgi:ABC-type uncharacterized transport system involved in gliding motility auxiliary subunit